MVGPAQNRVVAVGRVYGQDSTIGKGRFSWLCLNCGEEVGPSRGPKVWLALYNAESRAKVLQCCL